MKGKWKKFQELQKKLHVIKCTGGNTTAKSFLNQHISNNVELDIKASVEVCEKALIVSLGV